MQSWEADLSQKISYLHVYPSYNTLALHYLLKKKFFSHLCLWQWSVFLYNQHLNNWLNMTCSLLVQTIVHYFELVQSEKENSDWFS